MTISEQVEEIKCEICDKVCRWKEYSLAVTNNTNDAEEYLEKNYCESCPLGRL